MHPADIQAAIKKRGLTQKKLAQEFGCSEMSISLQVNGIAVSEAIRKFIAAKIDRNPKEVFYEYYSRPKNKRRPGKKLTREKVEEALAQTNGNRNEAINLLGVCRSTFYNFLSKNRKAA